MKKHIDMKDRGFSQVSNDLIRDERLSNLAKVVFILMQSWSETFNPNIRILANKAKSDNETVRKALRQLESCGYLKRNQQARTAGKFGSTEYELFDPPFIPAEPDQDKQTRSGEGGTAMAAPATVTSDPSKEALPNADLMPTPSVPERVKCLGEQKEELSDAEKVVEIYRNLCRNLKPCNGTSIDLDEKIERFLDKHDPDEWAKICEYANRTPWFTGLMTGERSSIFFLLEERVPRMIEQGWFDRAFYRERESTQMGKAENAEMLTLLHQSETN